MIFFVIFLISVISASTLPPSITMGPDYTPTDRCTWGGCPSKRLTENLPKVIIPFGLVEVHPKKYYFPKVQSPVPIKVRVNLRHVENDSDERF